MKTKTTRIFSVEFYYVQTFDGKRDDGDPIKETRNIVAKDAAQAVGLVGLALAKESSSFVDEDTKKKVDVGYVDYDPINVTLEAEA